MTSKGERPRLLLVEDDRATYTALRGILSLRGWDVRVATSLNEARVMLRELGAIPPAGETEVHQTGAVDAVILDLMLPDGAGEALIEEIRQFLPDIPVAVTTGLNEGRRIEAVQQMGATALLRKPIALAELLKVIGQAKR